MIFDSGSSDLWVRTNASLKLTNDSGLSTVLGYGGGNASGPIQFAELKVGEYTVPSQGANVCEVYVFVNVNRLFSVCERQEGSPSQLLTEGVI